MTEGSSSEMRGDVVAGFDEIFTLNPLFCVEPIVLRCHVAERLSWRRWR